MSISNAAQQPTDDPKKKKEWIKGTPENKKETDKHASTKWQNKIKKHLKRRQIEINHIKPLGPSDRNKMVLWPGLKVVPCETFTKRTCDGCGSLQKGGNVVATCNFSVGVALNAYIYTWREQAIIEWSWRVICQSVKFCAHAARTFWSQHQNKEMKSCN